MKLRYCEPWCVVRLSDGTPVVVTGTDKRGARMVKIGRDHGRWVSKDDEVTPVIWAAELAHDYLDRIERPIEVPKRPCDNCGEPMDNLLGQFLVRGEGRTMEVCHRCYPMAGYEEIGRAKGLGV